MSKLLGLTFTITGEQKMTDIMQDRNTRLEIIRREVIPEIDNDYIER